MNTQTVVDALQKVRIQHPLVHNITNYVVMNNTANALLAVGAAPVMAHAIEEVEDMVSIAGALVLNMGTLDSQWVESMVKAGSKAHALGKPIVLDPVGAGATSFRTCTAQKLIETCKPSVIRGNASEIMSLMDSSIQTSGVDSSAATNEAEQAASALAIAHNCVVVVSGPEDFITDGKHQVRISNGSTMMARVTGTGCTCTAMIGAFLGVCNSSLEAATAAMVVMAIAGQEAANDSKGSGSLQLNLIDYLYSIDAALIESKIEMTYV